GKPVWKALFRFGQRRLWRAYLGRGPVARGLIQRGSAGVGDRRGWQAGVSGSPYLAAGGAVFLPQPGGGWHPFDRFLILWSGARTTTMDFLLPGFFGKGH